MMNSSLETCLRKTLKGLLIASLTLTSFSDAQTLPLGDYIALQPGTWNYTSSGIATPVVTATRTDYTRVTNITGGSSLTTHLRLTDEGLILLGEVSTIPGDSYNETENPVTVLVPLLRK